MDYTKDELIHRKEAQQVNNSKMLSQTADQKMQTETAMKCCFLNNFFDGDHFFKVFIEFVTILLLFYVLFIRHVDLLSSLTRD